MPGVPDAAFTCPWCSRALLKDVPADGVIPRHLDVHLGLPCEGSGRPLESVLAPLLDLPAPEGVAVDGPAFPC